MPATTLNHLNITVRPARAIRGVVRIPGDKSVSHRALLLAALAEGTSTIRHLSDGEDVRRTALAVVGCGAQVSLTSTGDAAVTGGAGLLHEGQKEHGAGEKT